MIKKIVASILVVALLLIGAVFAKDYWSRYSSLHGLSAERIEQKAQWYISNRASDVSAITAICVYAVECVDDQARLAKISDVKDYNFEALKQNIWKRRFDNYCTGRTANFGLHIFRGEQVQEYWHSDNAIWSFNNNRFIPRHGRFAGGAFSEEPWERCTLGSASYHVENGTLKPAVESR